MAEKEIKHAGSDRVKRSYFDKSRREEYTILIPDMLPIHFKLIMAIYKKYGYNMELLQNCSRNVIDEGLKNTHNDACYPALLVIGQFMDALKSGKYDLEARQPPPVCDISIAVFFVYCHDKLEVYKKGAVNAVP